MSHENSWQRATEYPTLGRFNRIFHEEAAW
jgi:hypothetical protein